MNGAPRSFPLFIWPIEHPLNAGIALGNYVDDDPSGAVHDYMGFDSTYDGHLGTDFGMYSFRAMDRGEEVFAAAGGTVAFKQDGKFDRSVGPPWPDDGNYLGIDHGDGSFAFYLHLRKNSITVDVGETVAQGQILGLAASSGYSWGPHLHFETGEYAPTWTFRDPWNGTYNMLPSLWVDQEPYVGDDLTIIHDMGIVTEDGAGGDFGNIPYNLLIEGFVPAAVFGTSETKLAMWVLFQGNPGGSFRMEVRKPNGALFYWNEFPISFKAFPQTGFFPFNWSGSVGSGDHGTWQAQVFVGGSPVITKTFVVGAATRYAPRFWPVAGRSFRINGAVQRDTLRVAAGTGATSFSLVSPPSFVTLESDSIVRIAAASTQATRSVFFYAVATNASADKDTMAYHVVDPTKPLETPTGIDLTEDEAFRSVMGLAFPNPFREETTIRYSLPGAAGATFTIVDVAGRVVQRVMEPESGGTRTFSWNGRDAQGRPVPAGVYFLRLQSGDVEASQKLLRTP
jgi:hypothetical protein